MNRSTTATRDTNEARLWFCAIFALFILLLGAAYYRFGGFGNRTPTSVVKASPIIPAEIVPDDRPKESVSSPPEEPRPLSPPRFSPLETPHQAEDLDRLDSLNSSAPFANSLRPPNSINNEDAKSLFSNQLPSETSLPQLRNSAPTSVPNKASLIGDSTNELETTERHATLSESSQVEIEPAQFESDAIERKAIPTVYSVVAKENESYWSIAQRVYKDGRMFRALHALNSAALGKNVKLDPGALVQTPPLSTLIKQFPKLVPPDMIEPQRDDKD